MQNINNIRVIKSEEKTKENFLDTKDNKRNKNKRLKKRTFDLMLHKQFECKSLLSFLNRI